MKLIIKRIGTGYRIACRIYIAILAVTAVGTYWSKLFGDAEGNDRYAHKLWLSESFHGFETGFKHLCSLFGH